MPGGHGEYSKDEARWGDTQTSPHKKTSPPKSGDVFFVFDVETDHFFHQAVVDFLTPSDSEEHGRLIVARLSDFFGEFCHGRLFRGHGEMVLCHAESDDEGAVIRKHRLIPGHDRNQTGKCRVDPSQQAREDIPRSGIIQRTEKGGKNGKLPVVFGNICGTHRYLPPFCHFVRLFCRLNGP